MNEMERFSRWMSLLSGEVHVPIATTPRTVVYQRDRMVVYRYTGEQPPRHTTPILLVYSLINRPAILDLQPARSVVRHLLSRGFDVYLLDWGVPDGLDQLNGLDIHLNLLLRTAVRQVCLHAEQPQATLLGYCMGGTLAAMYTALHPERVRNLILLGAPFSFRSDELLYKWSSHGEYRPEDLVEACGNAPSWAFEGFTLLKLDQQVARKFDLYWHVDDPKYVDAHLAMEQWVGDNVPMPGVMFVEFIRQCFIENALLRAEIIVGGRKVDLSAIDCPTLVLSGKGDHLVPPETSLPLADVLPHCETIVFPTGHIGLSVSGGAHRQLWPQVCDWLVLRSSTPTCNTSATPAP